MDKIVVNVNALLRKLDEINLTEMLAKVSKQELSQVLKDNKVYVGGEFEFYHYRISESGNDEDAYYMWEEANGIYQQYVEDVYEWEQNRDEWFTEQSERYEELNEEIQQIEEQIEIDAEELGIGLQETEEINKPRKFKYENVEISIADNKKLKLKGIKVGKYIAVHQKPHSDMNGQQLRGIYNITHTPTGLAFKAGIEITDSYVHILVEEAKKIDKKFGDKLNFDDPREASQDETFFEALGKAANDAAKTAVERFNKEIKEATKRKNALYEKLKKEKREGVAKSMPEMADMVENLKELEKERDELQWVIDNRDEAYLKEEKAPPTPEELIDYANDYQGGYPDYDEYYTDSDDIPAPEEPEQRDISDNWEDAADETLSNYGFPFDYKVSGYHGEQLDIGDNHWSIQYDGSLGEEGMEAISPPMELQEFFKSMKTMFDFIDEQGYTDSGTGFHIHMSLKDVPDLKKALDPLKLTMFTDEEKIWKFFKDRASSTYVNHMKNSLIKNKTIKREDLKKVFDLKKIAVSLSPSHYDAINFEHLDSSHGRIEFRYLGGSEYHKKYDQIRAAILVYAYNLSLACDPTFKKKEYLKKLIRAMTKKELSFDVEKANILLAIQKIYKKNGEPRKSLKHLSKLWLSIDSRLTKMAKVYNIEPEQLNHTYRGIDKYEIKNIARDIIEKVPPVNKRTLDNVSDTFRLRDTPDIGIP